MGTWLDEELGAPTPGRRRPSERTALAAAERTRVADIMTRDATTVRPELAVEQLVELLLEQGLSRVPVVDEEGRLVGIVSKTDLVAEQQLRGDTHEEVPVRVPRGRGIAYPERGMHVQEAGATVREVMRPRPVTLGEQGSVAEAAELMVTHRLHGLPVVSGDERVVGMVSLLDVAAWVAGLA